jgi:hypothetical protein
MAHDEDDEARARIWIIGADHWPRAYLRAELIERGYDAVGYLGIRDALVDLALAPSRRPRLVVLDLLGQIEDETVVAALIGQGAPVVALAGATAATEERLLHHPWAAFLRRPLTIGQVADLVDRRLTEAPHDGE